MATYSDVVKRLSEQMARGEVVLFTGAGFSTGAADHNGRPIPQVRELTQEIAGLVWPDDDADDELTLADTYDAALREKRTELSKLMRDRLTINPETVTSNHIAWLSIPWLRAYTLNIDDLESAGDCQILCVNGFVGHVCVVALLCGGDSVAVVDC